MFLDDRPHTRTRTRERCDGAVALDSKEETLYLSSLPTPADRIGAFFVHPHHNPTGSQKNVLRSKTAAIDMIEMHAYMMQLYNPLMTVRAFYDDVCCSDTELPEERLCQTGLWEIQRYSGRLRSRSSLVGAAGSRFRHRSKGVGGGGAAAAGRIAASPSMPTIVQRIDFQGGDRIGIGEFALFRDTDIDLVLRW